MKESADQQTSEFVRQLDAQLQAIQRQLKTAPSDFREPVSYAVTQTRDDLQTIRSGEQLRQLADRYRTDTTSQPTAVTLIRAQIIERIDKHYQTPATIEITPASHEVRTQTNQSKAQDVKAAPQNPEPAKRNLRDIAPQPGELVVFRNGDQNRWGIIERRGDLLTSENKHQHPDGWQDTSGWRLRANEQGSHYQLRVSGIPHVVPATTITHTIDPKQQPDLPIDSIIEQGSGSLRVQSITWGDDAQRLRTLAAGKPSMLRMPHVTDGWDLRDGIGTNNERNDPADRYKQTNYRDDQQQDFEYIRTQPKSAEQHRERNYTPTPGAQRLPTAGPRAMGWAANLDNVDPTQTRVIVAGSRELQIESAEFIKSTLETRLAGIDPSKITLVHGGASGADQLASKAGRELGMNIEVHRADWNTHGKAAGPIRNQQMVDAGAHRVIAFVGKPLDQSRGTADLIDRAGNKNIPTSVVNVPMLTRSFTPSRTLSR